jgi:hypothetical protein
MKGDFSKDINFIKECRKKELAQINDYDKIVNLFLSLYRSEYSETPYSPNCDPSDFLTEKIKTNPEMIEDTMAFLTPNKGEKLEKKDYLEAMFLRNKRYLNGSDSTLDRLEKNFLEDFKERKVHCAVIGTAAILGADLPKKITKDTSIKEFYRLKTNFNRIEGKSVINHIAGINFEGKETSHFKKYVQGETIR